MMQQTEKYKLNLIDPEDTFSPGPLNENALAVEKKLSALESGDAALQTAIGSGGKTCRFAWGTCKVSNSTLDLTFDFRPVLLLFSPSNDYRAGIAVRGKNELYLTGGTSAFSVTWTDTGCKIASMNSYGATGGTYIVIGESV